MTASKKLCHRDQGRLTGSYGPSAHAAPAIAAAGTNVADGLKTTIPLSSGEDAGQNRCRSSGSRTAYQQRRIS